MLSPGLADKYACPSSGVPSVGGVPSAQGAPSMASGARQAGLGLCTRSRKYSTAAQIVLFGAMQALGFLRYP
jgi:hypothetical protein